MLSSSFRRLGITLLAAGLFFIPESVKGQEREIRICIRIVGGHFQRQLDQDDSSTGNLERQIAIDVAAKLGSLKSLSFWNISPVSCGDPFNGSEATSGRLGIELVERDWDLVARIYSMTIPEPGTFSLSSKAICELELAPAKTYGLMLPLSEKSFAAEVGHKLRDAVLKPGAAVMECRDNGIVGEIRARFPILDFARVLQKSFALPVGRLRNGSLLVNSYFQIPAPGTGRFYRATGENDWILENGQRLLKATPHSPLPVVNEMRNVFLEDLIDPVDFPQIRK